MVNIKINGIRIQVPNDTTVLEAAKKVGIHIPTLCYMKLDDFGIVNRVSSCRVCVVEEVGNGLIKTINIEEIKKYLG